MAAYFDGVNSAITLGDIPLGAGEEISFACWFRIDDLTAARCIVSQWDTTDTSRQGFILYIQTDGDIFFYTRDGSGNGYSRTTNASHRVQVGQWHFIAFSWHGDLDGNALGSGLEIYLDDYHFLAGDADSGADYTKQLTNVACDIMLGRTENGGYPLIGQITDACFWVNVQVSGDTFLRMAKSRLKRSPILFREASPTLYLPMDEHPHQSVLTRLNRSRQQVWRDLMGNYNGIGLN